MALLEKEIDEIIKASASTYTPEFLIQNGLKISLNLSYLKTTRFVQDKYGKKIYPEIVLWKPYEGSDGLGEVQVIEFIETEKTYFSNWINGRWNNIDTSDIQIQLIVPKNTVGLAKSSITGTKINLQSYTKLPNGKYLFMDEK